MCDVCALLVSHVMLSRAIVRIRQVRFSPSCGPLPKAERVSTEQSAIIAEQSMQIVSHGDAVTPRLCAPLVVVIESLA